MSYRPELHIRGVDPHDWGTAARFAAGKAETPMPFEHAFSYADGVVWTVRGRDGRIELIGDTRETLP